MTITARRAATQSKLLDGAAAVIVRTGVGAATVEQICDEAGFTRGAFYSNFESMDDLLIALLERQIGRINALTKEVVDEAASGDLTDLRGSIHQATMAFVSSKVVEPASALLMAELQVHAVREPSIREAYARANEANHRTKAELISAALTSRGLRLVVDPHQAVLVLEGAAHLFILGALSKGEEPDQAGLAAMIAELLSALVAPAVTTDAT